MTGYVGYLWPTFELYLQTTISGSLTSAALPPPTVDGLSDDFATPLYGVAAHSGAVHPIAHAGTAFVMPTYAEDLFDHFLVVPSILTLGNLLTNQQRTVEVANLYSTPKQVTGIVNNAGTGITFPGLATFPAILGAFNSFILTMAISTNGQPSIKGTLVINAADVGGLNPQALVVPVTGQRITLFPWDPEQFYTEKLQWKTDVIEAYTGIEQRIGIRLNPRQVLTYEVFARDPVKDAAMRLVLFNWLPRVWGVPIWWEQQPMTNSIGVGATSIPVNTTVGDFRASGLVLIQNPAGQYETFQIDTLTASAINVTSQLLNNYPVGSKVMPVRTAVAKTQTQSRVYITGPEKLTVEFTTLDNIGLADITSWTLYAGLPVLDDINFVESTLTEGMNRTGVIIIDNGAGRIYQQAASDRSRPTSVKTWWTNTAAEIWKLRQLLHWMHGNQNTFWLPTNRNDLIVVAPINSGATSFTASYVGYSLYAINAGGGMRPFGDVRITLVNGTKILRRITGCTSNGATEVFSLDAVISGVLLNPTDIARVEFLQLVRIADDQATLTHDHPGRASVVINVVGVQS